METPQQALFHEDIRDALKHCVAALGGPKAVAADLWPSLGIEQARSRLNNCLDSNRAEKLGLEEMLFILRQARQKGVHSGMAYILRECGYEDPKPVEPEDERAQLQRDYIQATQLLAEIAGRMDRVDNAAQAAPLRSMRER